MLTRHRAMDTKAASVEHRMELSPASIWKLCWKCFRLLRKRTRMNKLILEREIKFFRSWNYLMRRNKKGCQLCIMIGSKVGHLRAMKEDSAASIDLDNTGSLASGETLEFKLCQGEIIQKGMHPSSPLAIFANLETLRIEIRVRDGEKLQWSLVQEFNVAAAAGTYPCLFEQSRL